MTTSNKNKNRKNGWQRARSSEQKAERRRAIKKAAATLYERDGLDKASLNAIARQAGISKANIYRYFESREEIFLHLILSDMRTWVSDVENALAPLAGSGDTAAVARTLVGAMVQRPRLGNLLSEMSSVLERNITVEVVIWFKTSMHSLAIPLGNTILVALPQLTPDDVLHFVHHLLLLVIGMWPAANPPPAVSKAFEHPELKEFKIDFERDLTRSIEVVFKGLEATH